MPGTVTITIRYLDGGTEKFTGCTTSQMPDDTNGWLLVFVGTLDGESESATHRIRIADGMRWSVKST